MKDEIKALRVEIDRVTKQARELLDVLNRGVGAREIALAVTRLEEAKMWGGKALGAWGIELPLEYRDES